MVLERTSYAVRSGEPVEVAAPPETVDFLLKAKTLKLQIQGGQAGSLVAAHNRAHDRLLLAAPTRTLPGDYSATLSATSEAGEERAVNLTVAVQPRQRVPSNSTRPPVVLLNGWETGITGACPVSTSSSETFGNLAQYLVSDGVPIVYLFDNCAEDPNQLIEGLGNDLGNYLKTIQYDNGTQVAQIDLVAFSMGGLIVRSYLAGIQSGGTFSPPSPTLVHNLVLIASPNFGSFVAGNYINSIPAGTQSAELVPASSFLWNLATWNQRGDDMRGINALAIVGNAGAYLPGLSATEQLNNASDGLVSTTSASAGFTPPPASMPTQVVPYCHVDPSAFTNTTLGALACNAAGIANVTSTTHETGEIVRSFLAGTTDWTTIGNPAAGDTYLSTDGGIYFAMQGASGAFVTDLTQVVWGTVPLFTGGDTDTVYYTDFVSGSGDYRAISSSVGTVDCATLTEPAGYFSPARCKIGTAIFSVGPLACVPGRVVNAGAAITLTGTAFGSQCTSCQVLATPAGSSTQTALQVSSWTNTSISAALPSSLTGLLTIQVKAVPGTDAITVMAVAPGVITGVCNAGSFRSGFASATWVAIFGTGFSSTTGTWQSSDFVNGMLPTSLDGVSVTVNHIPAYVEYVSSTQINVLAPDDPATGPVEVQLTAAGQTVGYTAQKQLFAPAWFTFSSGHYVAAQHADYSYILPAAPARPGEIVLLYGTGFGPTKPALPTASQVTTAEPLANTVQITIGGLAATVKFAGLSAPGLYQFNVTVPSLSNGDAPVVATIGGVQTQTGVSLSVHQ
ncbi:MAG TPA: IPT/TIG domain-containing protein [Bryobacteraceae bacterium]|nr:IPT/TIG domain-containing protein [Bryobacteraceae bacterium]